MDGIIDHVVTVPASGPASGMMGDDVPATANHDPVDIAAQPNTAVAIGNRHRIVVLR